MSFEIGQNLSGFNTSSYLKEGQGKAGKKENTSSVDSASKSQPVSKLAEPVKLETGPSARLNAIANRSFESHRLQEEISILQSQGAALEEAFQVLEKIDSIISDGGSTGASLDLGQFKSILGGLQEATFNNRPLFDSPYSNSDTVPFQRSISDYNVTREEMAAALEPVLRAESPADIAGSRLRSAANAVSEMIGRTGAVESQVASNALAALGQEEQIDLGSISSNMRRGLDPRVHGNLQPGNIPRLIN